MSLSDLETALKTVTDCVYEREAPAGVRRYIVWHQYNAQTVDGDDRAALRVPRVQVDVFWQQRIDTLLDDVLAVLDYWRVPVDIQDITWDDERQLHRAILQMTWA